MKVFISWSGEPSRSVAALLHSRLKFIFNNVEVFMSEHDIDSGERWSNRINLELEETSFGIFCLTSSNIDKPWVHFEAGAISKLKGRVAGLLLGDLSPTDFNNPLTQFQNLPFDEKHFRKLISDMDVHAKVGKDIIENNLSHEWPKINSKYREIMTDSFSQVVEPVSRSNESISQELLERTRSIEKILSAVSLPSQNKQSHSHRNQDKYSKFTVQLTLSNEKTHLYKEQDVPTQVIDVMNLKQIRGVDSFQAKNLDINGDRIDIINFTGTLDHGELEPSEAWAYFTISLSKSIEKHFPDHQIAIFRETLD